MALKPQGSFHLPVFPGTFLCVFCSSRCSWMDVIGVLFTPSFYFFFFFCLILRHLFLLLSLWNFLPSHSLFLFFHNPFPCPFFPFPFPCRVLFNSYNSDITELLLATLPFLYSFTFCYGLVCGQRSQPFSTRSHASSTTICDKWSTPHALFSLLILDKANTRQHRTRIGRAC